MIIIEAQEVREKLTAKVCIELMREAFTALESGRASQPVRTVSTLPHDNTFFFMPAYLGDGDYFGAKVMSGMPANPKKGMPLHLGYVMLFDSEYGAPVGMADCTSITEIRTGAVSAVATDILAKKDAEVLGLIGAGAQARSHVAAMLEIRPIKRIQVFDMRIESSERFAREMNEKYGVEVIVCDSAERAVHNADIVCTLTPSKEPFLKKEWIKPGAHINAVGTFSPTTREVTSELFAASKVYADELESCEKESGEYLVPLAEGLIQKDHIVGSLGQLVTGKVEGRTSDEEITMFDALGLAVEDVIACRWLVKGY